MTFSAGTVKLAEDLVAAYKATVAQGYTGIEMATRPMVHGLLVALLGDASDQPLDIVHDQFVSGTKNKPDWAVYQGDGGGVYFYGDHKPAGNEPLTLSTAEKSQIERYRTMGSPVLVFDGVAFLFFEVGIARARRVDLFDRQALANSLSRLVLNPNVLDDLRLWLKSPGFRKVDISELIEQAAFRARLIREELEAALGLARGAGFSKGENDFIDSLLALREDLVESGRLADHDAAACADFVAQVLAFGFVYAHVMVRGDSADPQSRARLLEAEFTGITDSPPNLPPFAEIVSRMSDTFDGDDGFLGYWYRDAIRYFSNVQEGTKDSSLDYHTLFEEFLKRYDPKARFDFGAFYTPKELADWMGDQADELARRFFGADLEEIADQIIDPCCGTGGILESLIERRGGLTTASEYVGIEILPVPYALAQFRLRAPSQSDRDNVKLYLADTLDDSMLDEDIDSGLMLAADLNGAREHARRPVRVVVGNPPSVQNSPARHSRSTSDAQIDLFRPSATRGRSNIQKALNNDALRFLAWSAIKVIESGYGIVALVLPGSIAASPSYVGVRKWLVENFDYLRIVELDADLRTGEASQSIFKTKQGRLALFAVRSANFGATYTQVDVHNIRQLSRAAKFEFLAGSSEVDYSGAEWSGDLECRFVVSEADPESWVAGEAIFAFTDSEEAIFLHKESGVKLAPTHLVFHTDVHVLTRRSTEIGRKSGGGTFTHTVGEIQSSWFAGQERTVPDHKLAHAVRDSIGVAAGSGTDYTYRPFAPGFAILDASVFASLKDISDGTRPRPDLQASYRAGAIGIAIAPDPTALGSELGRFATFAWTTPDNDLVARGNAMIYTDIWASGRGANAGVAGSNVKSTSSLRRQVDSDQDVIFCIYALFSSQKFTSKFNAQLYRSSSAGHFPRIPILGDGVARKLAFLGRRLAEIEKPGSVLQASSSGAELADSLFEGHADWPAEFDLLSSDFGVNSITLVPTEGSNVVLSEIPHNLLVLRICGHDVIKKWLREREYPYLRRKMNPGDIKTLVELIVKLHAQGEVIAEIDDALASEF